MAQLKNLQSVVEIHAFVFNDKLKQLKSDLSKKWFLGYEEIIPTDLKDYLKQFLSIKEEEYSISANNGLNSEKLEEEFEQFEDKYNLSEVENDFSHTVNDFINVVNDDLNINVNFQDPLGNTNGHLFPEICLFSRN